MLLAPESTSTTKRMRIDSASSGPEAEPEPSQYPITLLNPERKAYQFPGVSAFPAFPLTGYWFRAGAGQALVTIRGQPISGYLRASGPVIFNGGEAHGNGTVYENTISQLVASVEFNHKANEEEVKHHRLIERYPGIMLAAHNWEQPVAYIYIYVQRCFARGAMISPVLFLVSP